MFMKERAKMLSQLWRDAGGSVLSAEVVLLATILVLGIVVGAKSFRDAAVTEWADYAQAIGRLDQSYNIPNIMDSTGTTVVLWGGHFLDLPDHGDLASDGPLLPGDTLAFPVNIGGFPITTPPIDPTGESGP